MSGGVDSTVCTALLCKVSFVQYEALVILSAKKFCSNEIFLLLLLFQALGANAVHAVHIDNGFMRKNESQQVAESLREFGLKLTGGV